MEFPMQSLSALPGVEHAAFLAAMAQPAQRALRLRPGYPVPEGLQDKVPWAKDAYYIADDTRWGANVLHAAGAYYLQEPSAMAAVGALDVQPGQRVLDLCAAPGGKSTQIAAQMAGHGVLVSNEIVPGRAKVLSGNMERLGVSNAIVTSAAPDVLAAHWPQGFDRILVDAPCSGEGMFRRDPAARVQWTPQSPGGCAVRQAHILASAAQMLAPGGALVYSTCTFNAVENERMVQAFLQAHPDFAPEDFVLEGIGASEAGCLRIWPHRVRGEGHFVARLRKRGEPADVPEAPEMVSLGDVLPVYAGIMLPGTRLTSGDHMWVAPQDAPPLDGIRVLRNGLAVAAKQGKQWMPDHAAAMAFPPRAFVQHIAVSEQEARRFLRGETLLREGAAKGWTAVGYAGLGLGWAKVVDGVLKNHLPKGLRI